MASMNAGIILAGQQYDPLGSMARGNALAQQTNEIHQQNALADLYRTQGAGILAGDQNALNALAGFDPHAALNVQSTRQGMEINAENLKIARENARLRGMELKATMDARQAEKTAAELDRALGMATKAQTPEQWDRIMMGLGDAGAEFVGQFENRDMIIAGAVGLAEALKMNQGPEPMSPEGKFEADRRSGLLPEGTPPGGGTKPSAAEAQIGRIQQAYGVDYQTAVGIADGVIKVSQDPLTRSIMVTNLATGETWEPTTRQPGMSQPGTPPQPAEPPAPPRLSFGTPYSGAGDAFGPEGFARRALNVAGEATGLGAPFPETMQTQQDFAVLGEGIINDFASAYGRQPPSWLLTNIAELAPQAGRIFEGPQKAQTKLRSIGREMQLRRDNAVRSLDTRLSPGAREETEALVRGLDAALAKIEAALSAFGGGKSNTTSSGVTWSIVE